MKQKEEDIDIPFDLRERSKLIKNLEKEMREYADNLDFEKAIEIRNKISEIRNTII